MQTHKPYAPPYQLKPARKTLTSAEMAERRAKGLCYFCEDKFEPGHRCKGKRPQIYHIEVEEVEDEGDEFDGGEGGNTEEAMISLNALTGTIAFQTMRVKGYYGKKALQLLVDSGSTHDFLDEYVALKLGCDIQPVEHMVVRVANGNKMRCTTWVPNFTWKLQNEEFSTDVYLLPLNACDVVLGVHWLSTLGDIKWHFAKLTMQFHHQGRSMTLRGATTPKLSLLKASKFDKIVQEEASLAIMQVCVEGNKAELSADLEQHQPDLQELLSQHASVFAESMGLPPHRPGYDHHIILKEGTNPINIRPYRYPLLQKDVIEQLTSELLMQGVIRHSNSPYASPVVLVKKKDGGWRMCVDYRELNKATLKDRFPIPLVEDLLDELHGIQYFSKIDLRSGYYQIRVASEDIPKTAFRTHHGHFEFLVMSFGLTNAPSTFQALMNRVFQEQLRKYVLVFFDDILVYSRTWDDHLQHLDSVLHLLRIHSLLAKRSKCSFGVQQQIEYLGHLITPKGVPTDPSKIKAIL